MMNFSMFYLITKKKIAFFEEFFKVTNVWT